MVGSPTPHAFRTSVSRYLCRRPPRSDVLSSLILLYSVDFSSPSCPPWQEEQELGPGPGGFLACPKRNCFTVTLWTGCLFMLMVSFQAWCQAPCPSPMPGFMSPRASSHTAHGSGTWLQRQRLHPKSMGEGNESMLLSLKLHPSKHFASGS